MKHTVVSRQIGEIRKEIANNSHEWRDGLFDKVQNPSKKTVCKYIMEFSENFLSLLTNFLVSQVAVEVWKIVLGEFKYTEKWCYYMVILNSKR